MTTETDPTPFAETVAPWLAYGAEIPAPSPDRMEQRSRELIAAAKREDARRRWETLAADAPALIETDWARPEFDRNRDALAKVAAWDSSSRKGLLLTGETGLGKTRAIIALLRRLALDDGLDFRYWQASSWFSDLSRQNQYGRDEARAWIDAVAARRIVVIDDIGQEAVDKARSDWAQAWFFRFLDVRLAMGLPLIASTNLTAKQMADATDATGKQASAKVRGDPLLRRLTELCEVVKFV